MTRPARTRACRCKDGTQAASTVIYVPIGGNRMKPYERRREASCGHDREPHAIVRGSARRKRRPPRSQAATDFVPPHPPSSNRWPFLEPPRPSRSDSAGGWRSATPVSVPRRAMGAARTGRRFFRYGCRSTAPVVTARVTRSRARGSLCPIGDYHAFPSTVARRPGPTSFTFRRSQARWRRKRRDNQAGVFRLPAPSGC